METIRRAEERDIPKMLELLEQVNLVHAKGRPDIFKVNTKYSKEDLLKMFQDPGQAIFVYDEEGEVLGYAFTLFQQAKNHPILTDVLTLYVDDICVDEDARGRHIGSKLYEKVLEFARESGCYNVTLNVWELNPIAKSFYESLGMKVQRQTMEKILIDNGDF